MTTKHWYKLLYFPNITLTMSISTKYYDVIEKLWSYLPRQFTPYLITFLAVAFGVTVRGEWVLIAVYLMHQFGFIQDSLAPPEQQPHKYFTWSLQDFRLQNITYFFIVCNTIGFLMYFCIGGFLHWHWYVKQRDRPQDWKCQDKWLSPELERHSILYGCRSLLFTNAVTSLLSCYIYNGGYTTLYYQLDQYSWSWYFLQWPIIFCYQDYTTYLLHRLYHTPWLYKRFHKAHHKYVQPTAFSVTAIHPVEIMHIQLMSYSLPIFIVPCHWSSVTTLAIYTYYNGIIDHSGIDFKAPWWQPWRPDTIFHDNHHQYFHVNFGFNCFIWDKIHGTYRQTDRIYSEDIFYGKGKALAEASDKELQEEISQRLGENLKAHRHLNPLIQQSLKVQ